MFADMIDLLKKGETIDLKILRNRFDRALVKKIGVINTPYSFWSSDPKINPRTKELIWAAILLEDTDNFNILKGIAITEVVEKKRASGKTNSAGTHENDNSVADGILQELLELVPDESLRHSLEKKIKNISS
jgi:hypothetical protein